MNYVLQLPEYYGNQSVFQRAAQFSYLVVCVILATLG